MPDMPTHAPRGRQPISAPVLKEPSDKEVSEMLEQAGHGDDGYGNYVLLATNFFPDAEQARKAIGNPYLLKKFRKRRGNVLSLDRDEAERLLRAKAITPLGSQAGWCAQAEKSASEGDEDATLELKLEDARRRRRAIEAEEQALEAQRKAKDAEDGEE